MANGRKRKKGICFYLLEEEYEILQSKLIEANMTQSDFLRNMILFGAAHERTMFSKKGERDLIREINRIGNNLNQIAVKANSSKIVDKVDFEKLYNNYLELLGTFDNFARGENNGND